MIWLPRVPTDERFRVTEEVRDPRAAHYWDEGRLVAAHFGDPNDYDVYVLYAPHAAWSDPPQETGRPVVLEAARLGRALQPYL